MLQNSDFEITYFQFKSIIHSFKGLVIRFNEPQDKIFR